MKTNLLLIAMLSAFVSSAQVRLVKDMRPGSFQSSNPTSLYVYDNKLFFSATESAGGRYVFSTDGTSIGTKYVRFDNATSGVPAINNFGTTLFYEYNNNLYFDAKTSSGANVEIVKLTGANNAVTSIFDLSNYTSTQGSRFTETVGFNNVLLFNPLPSIATTNPVKIDLLNSANSGMLYPIDFSSNSNEFTVLGTSCFFVATNATNGREIWKTDGSNAGTSLYLDMISGSMSSSPDQLNVMGTQLTFVATHTTLGRELFRTNGTGSLTLIRDINTTGDANPTNVTPIGSELYFSATNGSSGQEPYFSSGANLLSTSNIKDINPGSGSSNPSNFTKFGSLIFFSANDGTNGNEFWVTDGAPAQTYMVKNINPTGDSNPAEFTVYNGKLYFTADNGVNGKQLWVSDGSGNSGTSMITINASGTSDISNLKVFNNELYFTAEVNGTTGKELYAYMDPALASNNFQMSENAIALYPNPTTNFFELTTNLNIENVEIYSLQGQLIKSFSKQNQYTVSEFAKGIYVVKVKTTEGTLNKSLIIE